MSDPLMNPYEEPQAKLETPVVAMDAHRINWFAIFTAGGIHIVVSIICTMTLGALYLVLDDKSPSLIVAILTPLPWIAAPAYLAKEVQYRWVVHGLIYSPVPTFILLAYMASTTPLDEIAATLILAAMPLQIFSIAVALPTMAVVRHFLRKSKRS